MRGGIMRVQPIYLRMIRNDRAVLEDEDIRRPNYVHPPEIGNDVSSACTLRVSVKEIFVGVSVACTLLVLTEEIYFCSLMKIFGGVLMVCIRLVSMEETFGGVSMACTRLVSMEEIYFCSLMKIFGGVSVACTRRVSRAFEIVASRNFSGASSWTCYNRRNFLTEISSCSCSSNICTQEICSSCDVKTTTCRYPCYHPLVETRWYSLKSRIPRCSTNYYHHPHLHSYIFLVFPYSRDVLGQGSSSLELSSFAGGGQL